MALVVILLSINLVRAQDPGGEAVVAGTVTAAAGEATVVRSGNAIPASRGMRLFSGDLLRTGADGHASAVLRDDTALSLGPDSQLAIDEFVYSPAQGRLSMLLRMIRGTLAYLSGKIGKLSPGAARLETPVATIGVRGTRLAIRVEGGAGR